MILSYRYFKLIGYVIHFGYKLNEGYYITVILKDDTFWCRDDLDGPVW